MKTAIIVQARMGSTRLPGKLFKEVLGRSLLDFQMERLKRVRGVDQVIVATTPQPADAQILDYCANCGISSFVGSEQDVLARYHGAARQYGVDTVIRITSDCPLIDPLVIEKVIELWQSGRYDYVSNTIERTYPRGMDTEVFSFGVLDQAFHEARDIFEREHVTPFFYRNPGRFKLGQVKSSVDMSSHRWTVDVQEDFELVRKIIEALAPTQPAFTLEDVADLLVRNPEWVKINQHVEQKKK